MKAVLRIVLGYFSMLPLQRWVSGAGAAMLAIGVLLTLDTGDTETAIKMTFAIALPGATLTALMPLAAGGIALRFVSSRSLLHLRPHGRICVLLGSTLAIALLAALMALPIMAMHHVFVVGGMRRLPESLHPATWFLGTAVYTVVIWLTVFTLTASRFTLFGTPLLVLAPVVFIRAHPPAWIIAAILSAWLIFSLWYWRVRRINRPHWTSGGLASDFGNFTIRPLERLASGRAGKSAATTHYLLGAPFLTYLAIGAFLALLALVMWRLMPPQNVIGVNPLTSLTAVPIIGVLGWLVLRRARCLWLRAGLNRGALFRMAEGTGLAAALGTYCIAALILLAFAIPGRQQMVLKMTLYAGTFGLLTACVFYFSISLTRSWNAEDLALGIGIFALNIAAIIACNSTGRATFSPVLVPAWIAAGIFALLALLLRWHAMRRWRALDWRVAKLPRASQP